MLETLPTITNKHTLILMEGILKIFIYKIEPSLFIYSFIENLFEDLFMSQCYYMVKKIPGVQSLIIIIIIIIIKYH